jgi:hypothetical protein
MTFEIHSISAELSGLCLAERLTLPQEKQRIGIIILGNSGTVDVTVFGNRIARVEKIDVTCRPGWKRRRR